MPLAANELARRERDGLLTQPQTLRARWVLEPVASADGHTLRFTFACGVQALTDAAELRTLQDVLMGPKAAVTIEEVTQYFLPTLLEAARAAARERGVAAWLDGDRDLLTRELHKAAEKVAFACGLDVHAPFEVTVESPSFEQQRLKELQRKLAEEEAAGRVQELTRAASLLDRFEELRKKAPELPPGAILSQLNPADQGKTLQALLLASGQSQAAHDLWAVSGDYLIRIDTKPTPPALELIPMPQTLGPLRSVHAADVEGDRRLLVGARDGFFLSRPDRPADGDAFVDAGVESQQGFSRVVYQGRQGGFVGVHGEAGIVRWSLTQTDAPRLTIRPQRFAASLQHCTPTPAAPPPLPNQGSLNLSMAGSGASIAIGQRTPGPRNLHVIDDRRLLLSVGCKLCLLEGEEIAELPTASTAEIVELVPSGRAISVIHEDGTVANFDVPSRQIVSTRRRPMRVRSACSLPWLGSTRLLLAGDDGPVQCVGADDSLVSEYSSVHRGIRGLAGSANWVAGISADRQRLILWQTWDGRTPVAELYVTARTKHRLVDVEFA